MLFFSPTDPLRSLPGITLRPDAVTILHSAADYREQLLGMIRQARHRIYLCALYLQEDEGGKLILDALYAAAAANPELDIKVFVDAHRARRGLIGHGKQEGNAGWYRQRAQAQPQDKLSIYGVPVQTRELFGVMHLKGYVIDDTVLYSGASLNNVYLHVGDKYRFDRYHLISNAALADLLSDYMLNTLAANPAVMRLDQPITQDKASQNRATRQLRKTLAQSRYTVTANEHGKNGLQVFPVCGVGKNNPFNKLLENLLYSAKQQISICTPYFNLPRPLLKAIDKALARQVKVEIIVGDKTANDFYIPPREPFKVIGGLPYLYEMNLRRFAKQHQHAIQAGLLSIRLWQHNDNSFHLKGLWIDQHLQLITGNNLNPRAFRLDLENGLLLHDPLGQLASITAQELDNIRQHTRIISHYQQLEKLQHYPEKVRKLLSRLNRFRLDKLFHRLL
ncbi:CDP-diacylglycerol--serine O-phosphatidyltransferase [Vogesella sp. DC21W]|uniref:CDP-diacylglycerol--serine O-phosphatidyltransferase n=1 Tax=Vogesella aquatica TaxID=2984206 RepID=A0ABT5J1Y8_9NEIS|nr:CDP-diacylglycerol--serine O-phosphatidyltransferase [Vogesella aquatica]MDC7718859.1 CDP-diacylglycerol--serine O-phosphatidyltransferase [Vogesella aquatica]